MFILQVHFFVMLFVTLGLKKNMQTLLLTQLVLVLTCLFWSTVNRDNKNCVFGSHACFHTLSKNWLTFIADSTASLALVQKSSNGRDPELLLFTSHAYSLPSCFGARMWFYQQVSVTGTFCRRIIYEIASLNQ